MRKRKRKIWADMRPNSFTALIDMVFLLLIYFILQPVQKSENQLPADLPKSGVESLSVEMPLNDVALRIEPLDDDGAVFMVGDERIVSDLYAYRRIAEALRRQSGDNLETPVAITPAPDVGFEHVLRALDGCYQAGMPKIRFDDAGK